MRYVTLTAAFVLVLVPYEVSSNGYRLSFMNYVKQPTHNVFYRVSSMQNNE